jgi:hypothetical protein
MSSELERLAKELGGSATGAPVVVGQLQQMAAECRQQAGLLNSLADLDPAVAAAVEALEAAAQGCARVARDASRSPAKETAWAEDASGGPAGRPASGGPAGRPASGLAGLKTPRVRFDLTTKGPANGSASGAAGPPSGQDPGPESAPEDGTFPD